MSECIIGRIEFHLDLVREFEKTSCDEKCSRDSSSFRSNPLLGFVLVPMGSEECSQLCTCFRHTFYQLVVPQSLQCFVCDAERFSVLVRVDKYEMFACCNNSYIMYNSSTSSTSDDHGARQHYKILELHRGGIHCQNSEDLATISAFMTRTATESFSSLAQVATLEGSAITSDSIPDNNQPFCPSHVDTASSPSMKKRPKLKQKYFNLTARVDAISPIITAHPTDPFCLIELYEDNHTSSSLSTPLSAVVVFKGRDALSCHMAIQPGSILFLHHVRRIQWHVPSSFMKQCHNIQLDPSKDEAEALKYRRVLHRVPSHVFVVVEATSIMWGHSYIPSLTISSQQLRFPSVAFPLAAIEGIVIFVSSTTRSHRKTTEAHPPYPLEQVMEYILLDTKPLQSKLYIMYYPLSPDVLCGLCPGAVVRAVNIHRIDIPYGDCPSYAYFGACLRSTVSIVKVASEQQVDSVKVNTSRPNCHRHSYYLFPSYIHFENVLWLESIQQHWYLWHLVKSVEHKRFNHSMNNNYLTRLLENIILESQAKEKGIGRLSKDIRDPYAEFFNHACDMDPDETNFDCILSNQKNKGYPFIHGLMDIRTACFRAIHHILGESCERIRGSLSEFGKRYRIELDSFRLQHYLYERDSRLHNRRVNDSLFTGGLVVELNSHPPSQPVSLQDDHCRLACVPMSRSVQDVISNPEYLSCDIHDLVICRVGCVVISFYSLGQISNESILSKLHSENHIFPILCFPDGNEKQTVGSSSFLVISGIFLVVSVQVHYDKLYSTSIVGLNGKMKVPESITDHITISAPRRYRRSSEGAYTEKHGEMQYHFVICRFFRTDQSLTFKTTNTTLAFSHVPGPGSHQTIEFLAKFPSENIISRFKSSVQCCLDSSFADLIFSIDDIVRMASSLWILNESGRTAPLLTGYLDGHRRCFVDQDQRTMQRDIVILLPKQIIHSVNNDNSGIFSSHSVPLTPHSRTIADIVTLTVQGSQPLMKEPTVLLLTNTRVLHILFCKVEAACTLCFAPLETFTPDEIFAARKTNKDKVEILLNASTETNQRSRGDGKLRCPSGCGSQHAAIIWQCSCIIDDGTGQAKLYADGEACLKLLGQDLNTSLIEACAWQESLIFDKKWPPSQYLLDKINEGQLEMAHQTRLAKKKRLKLEDFMNLLPTRARAEYEFQLHCRYSNEPMRKMDLLCHRFGKESNRLWTEKPVEVISAVHEGSDIVRKKKEVISLARLELKLLDCVACDDPSITVWDELRALSS